MIRFKMKDFVASIKTECIVPTGFLILILVFAVAKNVVKKEKENLEEITLLFSRINMIKIQTHLIPKKIMKLNFVNYVKANHLRI